MISNQAYIHPDAKLGKNVTVEPFAYIAGDVVIGDDCWIGPGVIHDGARIGKGCKIHTAASIACTPQDLKFVGEKRRQKSATTTKSANASPSAGAPPPGARPSSAATT